MGLGFRVSVRTVYKGVIGFRGHRVEVSIRFYKAANIGFRGKGVVLRV